MVVTRRRLLGGLAVAAVSGSFPRVAEATLVRGLTLEQLAHTSHHILVGTPLQSSCRYETIGGQRRIVTDTRLRVDDLLAKTAPSDSEVMVCTLGGVLDGVGELVHGEAELVRQERSVVFLKRRSDGLMFCQGMAQGHDPLLIEARKSLLRSSPKLPALAAPLTSAVQRLRGRELAEARSLVLEVLSR
jgi:hypothetical protein